MVTSLSDIALFLLGWILLGIGYVFTIGLLLVPYSRLKTLWDADEGLDHLPVMYFLSLLNSLTWVAYGCLPPHLQYSVIIISAAGAVIQFVYIIWYICICAHPGGKIFIAFMLISLLLALGIVAWVMSSVGLFGGGPNSLDSAVTFTSVLMYAGPLGDTVTAIYSRDPAPMSVPIILVSFGNALSWCGYGWLEGLEIIRFANGLGMISPVIQIIVYLVLRRNDIPEIRQEIRQFFEQIRATRQEICQFFAKISEFVSQAYISLPHDENADA